MIYFQEAPWYSKHSLGLNTEYWLCNWLKNVGRTKEKQQNSINHYLHPTDLPSITGRQYGCRIHLLFQGYDRIDSAGVYHCKISHRYNSPLR